LADCISNYGPPTISLYSVTLWDALKFEILNVQEEDLADAALLGLSKIAATLSRGTTGSLAAYLKPVTKECNEHLEDAPTKQSQAAGSILHAIVSVSPEASNYVISVVLPHLFALYKSADSIAKRRGLVEVLIQLLRANIEVFGEWHGLWKHTALENGDTQTLQSISNRADGNSLIQFSNQTLDILINDLIHVPMKEVSYRLTILDGLLQLVKVRQLLKDDSIARVIKQFAHVVISEESYGKDEVKSAAISGLVEMARQKSQLMIDTAFPLFMAQLPDENPDSLEKCIPILEAFAKLAHEDKTFDTVVLRLKNKLNAAVLAGSSASYVHAILNAILYAFAQGSGQLTGQSTSCPYYEDFLQPLLILVANSSLSVAAALIDERNLDLVGRIANVILRGQTPEFQSRLPSDLYALFRPGPTDDLPPFKVSASTEQHRFMIVSTHLLAAMRKGVQLTHDSQRLLTALINYTLLDSISPVVRAASLRQVSLVLNKFIPSANIKAVLEPLLYQPGDMFLDSKLSDLSIRVVFAISKALVLRNATITSSILPSLLEALQNPTFGLTIARGFSSLLQPDDILNKENHCTISALHKQKTFNLIVPPLSNSFRAADTAVRKNYLVALSGILRWLPYTVIEPELSSIVPLLLQSLDLEGEDDVKGATIDTVFSLLAENPKAVEQHASSLITRLLNITATKRDPQRVRASALQCLTVVPGRLRMELVLPFRRQVVKKLTGALDDRRRAVRTEAVRCRAKWIELDEPGGAEEED